MTTLIHVARYQLMDRLRFVWLPIGITVSAFLVSLVVLASLPAPDGSGVYAASSLTLIVWLGIGAAITISMSLPFGLALGLSRRVYYFGTLTLVLGVAAVYSVGFTALYAVERATDGWGVSMHFFRVPWLFDGAWYVTLATSFVLLLLTLVYGMWFGIVYWRWKVVGLLSFIAGQILLLLGAALLVTWTNTWVEIGEFFTTLTVLGATGIAALATVALVVGGRTTIRGVTV